MSKNSWMRRILDQLVSEGDCLVFKGTTLPNGYTQIYGPDKYYRTHRLVYQECVGPLHDDLVIDHICRNRACVKPSHLRQITNEENVMIGEGPAAKNARKTHCDSGHEFTNQNTYFYTDAGRPGKTFRGCKACRRKSLKKWRAKVAYQNSKCIDKKGG